MRVNPTNTATSKYNSMDDVLRQNNKRKQLINKEHYEGTMFYILSHWSGTVWQTGLTKTTFYFPILFWLVPTIASSYWSDLHGAIPHFKEGVVSRIATIGAFVGFFVLFYTNQCYNRWWASYQSSRSCEARIFDAAAILRGYVGRESKHAGQILRYMNLAHLLGYVGLSSEYDQGFFDVVSKHHNLCCEEEYTRLQSIGVENGGRAYREVICWAVATIRKLEDADTRLDLLRCVLRLRDSIGSLYDYDFQPVPFMYFNMANWLVILYLPLMNYALTFAVSPWWVSLIIVVVTNVCLTGLLDVAVHFIYPYGHDAEDLAVYHFIQHAAQNSLAMLDQPENFPAEDGCKDQYLSYKPEGAYQKSWDQHGDAVVALRRGGGGANKL